MKKLSLIFACLLSILLMTVAVSADTPLFVDNAGLLSDSEAAELTSALERISRRYELDVAVLTSYGTERGMSTVDYCEYFFEQNYGVGDGLDGVILYINMSEREWNIATSGKAITYLTDYGLEYIEASMINSLSNGCYYDAFSAYATACEELLFLGESGEPYDYRNADDYAEMGYVKDYRTDNDGLSLKSALLISLAFGGIVSLCIVTGMKGQLKSVAAQRTANAYMAGKSVNLTAQKDIFLYKNVSRTNIPKDNSSSGSSRGGSTVHHSSSGHSFGGRSGRF